MGSLLPKPDGDRDRQGAHFLGTGIVGLDLETDHQPEVGARRVGRRDLVARGRLLREHFAGKGRPGLTVIAAFGGDLVREIGAEGAAIRVNDKILNPRTQSAEHRTDGAGDIATTSAGDKLKLCADLNENYPRIAACTPPPPEEEDEL